MSVLLRRFVLVAALLSVGCAGLPAAPPAPDASTAAPGVAFPPSASGAPTQVVLVSVRGLAAALLAGAGPADAAMPTLAAMAKQGVRATAVVGVSPPAVYPVHATLATGAPPLRHGIPADRRLGERGVRAARASHASRFQVATLWQVVAESGGGVASFDWPTTVGASIQTLLPDVAVTRSGERWTTLALQESTPDLGAVLTSPQALQSERAGPERDALLVGLACDVLRVPRAPRLVQLRLQGPAPALSAAGPGSAAAQAAYAEVDAQVARLARCLDQQGALARTAIVVVGDAGVAPVHTELRVNASLADAGLVERGRGGRISSWRALARSNGGSAFVYASDPAAAVEARRVLEVEAQESGAFRIVSAEEMIQVASDPEAWFGLEARPGFAFRDDARGASVVASRRLAASGYLEPDAAPPAALVAWGRGFRAGIVVPEMDHADVAPTLAALLRVSLPDATGRALVGGLALPSVSAPPAPEHPPEDGIPTEAPPSPAEEFEE